MRLMQRMGYKLGDVGVYRSGNIHVATVSVYLARDSATNRLGYFNHIDAVEAGYSFTYGLPQLNAYYAQGSGSVDLSQINAKAATAIEAHATVDIPQARTFVGRVRLTPHSRDKRILVQAIGGQLTWTANADARFALYRMPQCH